MAEKQKQLTRKHVVLLLAEFCVGTFLAFYKSDAQFGVAFNISKILPVTTYRENSETIHNRYLYSLKLS